MTSNNIFSLPSSEEMKIKFTSLLHKNSPKEKHKYKQSGSTNKNDSDTDTDSSFQRKNLTDNLQSDETSAHVKSKEHKKEKKSKRRSKDVDSTLNKIPNGDSNSSNSSTVHLQQHSNQQRQNLQATKQIHEQNSNSSRSFDAANTVNGNILSNSTQADAENLQNTANYYDNEIDQTNKKADEVLAEVDAMCETPVSNSQNQNIQNQNQQEMASSPDQDFIQNSQDSNHLEHDYNADDAEYHNPDDPRLNNHSPNDPNPQNLYSNYDNNNNNNHNEYDPNNYHPDQNLDQDPNNFNPDQNYNNAEQNHPNNCNLQQELDPYLLLHQTPITLPQIINHLDAIYFPPQQLLHLTEIKDTWSLLNNDIDDFTVKFNPKLQELITQHDNLIKKTDDVISRAPVSVAAAAGNSVAAQAAGATEGQLVAASARSGRFRGGSASSSATAGASAGATIINRSNPAQRRLAVDWENFAKKVNTEFEDIRKSLQYYLDTQHYLAEELNELEDTFDETDTVQLKLLSFKNDYQKLARDYRTLQFKLQHSKSQLIINATFDKCHDAAVLLHQEMKNIEENNLLLENRNNELMDELSQLKMNSIVNEEKIKRLENRKTDEEGNDLNNNLHDSSYSKYPSEELTKLEIQVLRESIAAISKENDKIQMLYQNSLKSLHNNMMIESNLNLEKNNETQRSNPNINNNTENRNNTSEMQSYLEDELQVLQQQMKETENEKKILQSEINNFNLENTNLKLKVSKLENLLHNNPENSSNTGNLSPNTNNSNNNPLNDLNNNNSNVSSSSNSTINNQNTARNLEIEAKLKKLKAQNDRYKKDRKRANQLATTLPEITMKDEISQLKKLTGSKTILKSSQNLNLDLLLIINNLEQKYLTIKEQNDVLSNELKKGGKYSSSKSSNQNTNNNNNNNTASTPSSHHQHQNISVNGHSSHLHSVNTSNNHNNYSNTANNHKNIILNKNHMTTKISASNNSIEDENTSLSSSSSRHKESKRTSDDYYTVV